MGRRSGGEYCSLVQHSSIQYSYTEIKLKVHCNTVFSAVQCKGKTEPDREYNILYCNGRDGGGGVVYEAVQCLLVKNRDPVTFLCFMLTYLDNLDLQSCLRTAG